MEKQLFWHQGLFLQPQHMQLKDLYDQSLLTPYNKFIQPHLWGVAELEIQEPALQSLSFHIDKGVFWFSDMTYAVLLENAVLEPRSFKEFWEEGGKPLTVYIGLKKNSSYGENVTVLPNFEQLADTSTRFVSTSNPEEVNDMHQGGSPANVKKMNLLLKIFFESEMEMLGDYDLIPVAKLERSGEEIKLSEQFIPPCVTIKSSSVLLAQIKEVSDQLSSRGHQLEAYKKSRGIHTAKFGSRDMIYLLALRSFNRYIPLLVHLMESNVHPWVVYTALRQIIGELSSFSEEINVFGENLNGDKLVKKYNHSTLWECFSGIRELVTRLMDELTAGPEYVINLGYDGTYYSTILRQNYFEGRNNFYLVMDTKEDMGEVLESVEMYCKISSTTVLPTLIARALPGLKIEYLKDPPSELPRRPNALYFRIDHHDNHWVEIKKANNIAIHWDTAPEDIQIEFMIVGRG